MKQNSYTNRDINALRNELITYIKSNTQDWTDFNESDLGMIMLELIVGVYDMLGFYLDKQALENYIDTVKQRKNAKSIASIVNYKSKMVKSCSTYMNCILGKNIDKIVKIPRYTKVNIKSYNNSRHSENIGRESINDEIMYVTAEDYTLYPQDVNDKKVFNIPIIQGEVIELNYNFDNMSDPLMKIYLDDVDVADSSVIVSVDGEDWEEVDDVLIDEVEGKKFSVHEDRLDRSYILLHPSYSRYVPVDITIPMSIKYLKSLGTKGKISINMVHSLDSSIYLNEDSHELLKDYLVVYNNEPSSSGADREPLELIARRAKNQATTLGVAIILEDYAKIVESIAGIYKAIAVDWSVEDSKYVNVPYKVDIYAVPESGYYISQSDLDFANKDLRDKCVSTIVTNVYSVPYVEIDLDLKIYSDISPDRYSELKSEIDTYIREQYNPRNQIFGQGLKYSNLLNHIHNSSRYISYAELKNIDKNIPVKYYEMVYIRHINMEVTRGD